MNILSAHESSYSINEYLLDLQYTFNENEIEPLKMCLKGTLLKSLEHQWKQPLNYISTNLLNLEINAELEKLNLKVVNEFNKNIEKAIQSISNNISFYNQLFATSRTKNSFFIHTICDNYFNIVEHKIRNNDIHFDYTSLKNNTSPLYNYENEVALQVVLSLFIITDILIQSEKKDIQLSIECQHNENELCIIIQTNYAFTADELYANHALYWKVISLLLKQTGTKMHYDKFNALSHFTMQMSL